MNNSLNIKTTLVFLGIIAVLAIALSTALLSRDIFPEKYFYDSTTIDSAKNSSSSLKIGDSYNNTAFFYKSLGLSEKSTTNKTLFPAIYIIAIALILRKLKTGNATGILLIAAYSSISAAVYLSQYSKESIVLLLSLSFLLLNGSKKGIILWLLLAIGYAIYFRLYWIITICLFISNLIILSKTRRFSLAISAIFILYIILAILFPIVYGQEIGQHRLSANEDRIGSMDAETLITPLIPGDGPVLDTINTFIQLITFLFPTPLAITGKVLHFLSFAAISSISIITIKNLRKQIKSDSFSRSLKLQSSYSLALAIVAVQAIFEPDYGSYVKHLTPTLPILLFLLNYHDKRTHHKK
ncbi:MULTISPECIES: hypothetical protein [Pseudomonas]|uniref:hypothetical protein n=1 Tax=Pseudomonas TaxID=286 RepID=UPI00114D3D72|nr:MULTISPECIES: hypothetical protein [Pseudomonas]MBH3432026.1 hypothetical protein [Pseudomonas citronellolis]